MLLHVKVSTCAPLHMPDGGTIHEARVRDATLPLGLRTPGEMVIWMSDDVRKKFPSGDAIEDAKVTIHVKEFSVGKNGLPKLKGQVEAGFIQPAQFGEGESPLPSRSQPSTSAPKADTKAA